MAQPSHPPLLHAAALPAQAFFGSPGQRVGLARERYFGDGLRPTGLVSEPVIQSWTRCLSAHRSPAETVAFDPVSRSRLQATLARNQELLHAARGELQRLEAALGDTGARVLLTDADGVLVHVTDVPARASEPVLKQVSRIGVNLAEGLLGTNAPAVVVKTGAAITVQGAEHYFNAMQALHCAAAPIRDGQGRLAGVLDLTAEARPFGFDAAALVGVYATAIENRLLQAGASEHLVLQFQVCASMLDSPLQALVGIDTEGRAAWLNGTAQQLLGHAGRPPADAEALFGCTLGQLLARATLDGARPLRLPNGLSVWLRARLQAPDGARGALALALAPARAALLPAPPAPPAQPAQPARPARLEPPTPLARDAQSSGATPAGVLAATAAPAAPAAALAAADAGVTRTPAAARGATPPATLGQHTREVIEHALAANGGNISRSAQQLGVSRGLLYRRLREWARPA